MRTHEGERASSGFAVPAVVDSCVFPHVRRWLEPLIDYARAGYLEPIWSPWIIAETNRLLTWLWLERVGGQQTGSTWAECSRAAKRVFARLTQVFRVVDDHPPHELLWTDEPADEWDVPVWNAAVRARARFIVTENVKDGPPPDRNGIRMHGGIFFVHPDDFLGYLDWYADFVTAYTCRQELPELAPGVAGTSELDPAIRESLIEILKRTGFTG